MRPGRQQTQVTLAIYSFLESQLSADPKVRSAMHDYLLTQFPAENADVTVKAGE
jgi:hypothetical protein